MVVRLAVVVFCMVIGVFVVSQLIVPGFFGKPLFPIFRRRAKYRAMHKRLDEIEESSEEERKLKRRMARIEKKQEESEDEDGEA